MTEGQNGCRSCRYLGAEFPHLAGIDGASEWRDCLATVPWWVTPRAFPMVPGVGGECPAYEPKSEEGG